MSNLRFILAATVLAAPIARAGILDPAVGVQTYRDFGENRGIYVPGATNVPIHKADGTFVGTVPVMPDFDSTVDGGWSALVGGPSFMGTVAHNNATSVSFTGRFGGSGVFGDSYTFINYNRMPNGYDYAAPRLNKIVTEVEASEYFLLSNYSGATTYPDAAGALYAVRCGGGTQTYATGSGTETTIAGGYAFLTGGTIKFTNNYQSVLAPDGFGYIYYNQPVDAAQPLDLGIRAGDSGSPSWLWNPTTARYEYIGAGQSGGGSGFGALNQMRGGNEWAVSLINACNSTINDSGGGAIAWNVDASGAGNFYQGASVVGTYIGLPNTVRGATSTVAADGSSTTYASNTQLDATRNLVFAGSGGTITVANPLDLGAGSLTFNANYTLAGARLNTAGLVVNSGATVTTQLTGASGDEWRKVGAGTLAISGTGDNPAKLNTGGGGLTVLNRSGGYAVSYVKINGDRNTTVRLVGDNQIAGANGGSSTVVFGHRGGRLDLYGHDASWTYITHLDQDANIANTKDNDASTFTFTGSGAQTYLGKFTDDGSAAAGLLDVFYNGGSGSVWSLKGDITNKGTWTVASGEVASVGTPTLHAGDYLDPDDWNRAAFNTGAVTIADGAQFTIDHHTDVASSFTANGTSTLKMTGADNTFTGGAMLNSATARFWADTPAGVTATVGGALTGTGSVRKDGPGILRLTNTANTLVDDNGVNAGLVSASAIGALGTGTAGWTVGSSGVISADNYTAAAVKAKVASGSSGTLALATTGGNPDNAPDMGGAGYANLFLGALGSVAVGNDPTTTTDLAQWSGGGWKLGGGGGTLTVNLRLNGTQGLTIGNGHNTGVVILANINNENTFSGTITVNQGVDLRYTDVRALGGGTLDVGYGSSVTTLTSGGNGILSRVSDPSAGVIAMENGANNSSAFDLAAAGLNTIHLGAEGTATYSGALTPGANGYRFGGDGALTVATALTGTRAVTVDGHNMNGGVVTLTGGNTFTGTLTVRGYDSSIITSGGTGTVTLRAGSATAFGAGAPVSLLAGGTLDLNGYNVTAGALAGAAGSGITNSSTTAAATLTVQQTSDATLYSTISSPGGRNLNLTKSGAGMLRLAGTNTHTGVHTVSAGVLRLGAAGALGGSGSTVVVQSGATFDAAGITPNAMSGVTIAGAGTGGMAALYNSSSGTTVTLGEAALAADATIGGASGSIWRINNLNPAGHTATLNTSRFNFNDGDHIGAGHVVANNGVVIYMSNTTTGGAGTLTLNSGATLDVRDFSNPDDAKTIVLNGGRIGNGYTHNGGGAQSTVSNPIRVDAASTIDGNNSGFGLRLNIAGALSGAGALSLASNPGVRLTGDTSGYTGTATINSGNGVVFNGTNDQVFNGTLAGGNELFKEGNRNLALTGTNSYSGGTEVLGGSLTVNALSGIGTGYLAVKNGATFVYNGSGSETTTRVLWLDNGAAVLQVANAAGSLTWNPSGGTIGGTNGGLITKTGAGALTIGGAFSGAASIAVDAGTLTLRGTNSHSGATSVNGGTLVLDYGSNNTTKLADAAVLAMAGGTVSLVGGTHTETVGSTTLAAGTASAITRPSGSSILALGGITRNAGATLDVGEARIATTTASLVNGLLPGVTVNGELATRDGSNYIVVYSNYTDVTRLSSGTKVIANDGTKNVRVIEGTGSAGDITLAEATTDAGTLTNTSTGGVATVAIGDGNTLRMSGAGHLVADDASLGLTLAGGTLTAGGAPDTAGAILVANHSSAATTIASVVADNGAGAVSLAKLGAGTLTLAGANTYSGATSVNAGTLQLGAANRLPDGAGKGGVSVAAGATLNLAGYSETVNGLDGAGTVDNTGASAATLTIGAGDSAGAFSGAIQDAGGNLSLVKTGSGTLTLSGTNTYAGTTTVSGGTLGAYGGMAIPDVSAVSLANTSGVALTLGSSEAIGSLAGGGTTGGNISLDSNTLTINQSATATYGGVISGAGGSLVKAGTGTLTLGNNASSFSGDLVVSAGTLATGTSAGGGTNGYLGAVNGSRTITVGAGATLSFLANNQFGGSGKNAAGIPTVVVDGGTLNATRFNILGNVVLNGATLSQSTTDSGNYDGYEFIGGTITVGGSAASTIATGNGSANHLAGGRVTTFDVADATASTAADLVVSAPLRDGSNDYPGAGALRKIGAGTLSLAAVNSFTGALTVAGGTLDATVGSTTGTASALGGGSNTIAVNQGATLRLSGGSRTAGYHSGAVTVDGGTITFNTTDNNLAEGNTLTFDTAAGTINGTGQWRRRDANNKVAVTAAASGSTISVADLNLYDNTPVIEVADGAAADDLAISSSITGAAGIGLTKTGAGTLNLTGTNTFSGTATVAAGTLKVNNTTGTGVAGAITVNSGGTLGGTGSVGGLVTVNSGGHFAPGNSVGTTTVSRLTLDAGSILDLEFNASTNDQVVVSTSGGLTIQGGSIYLYAEGGTGPASLQSGTTYNLIRYSGAIQGSGVAALRVANPVAGVVYTFGTSGGYVTLTVGDGTKSWDSGAPGDGAEWSTAANWTGDLAPTGGDVLVFGTGADTTAHNDLAGGTSFRTLGFDAANTASFTLNGNPITLTGELADNNALGNNINLDIGLGVGGGGINVVQANGLLTINGALSGAQPLVKLGSGTLVLAGVNTCSGDATIAAGTLEIAGAGQLGAGAFAFGIANSGLLKVNSTVGQTLSGAISGTGALVKENTGTLVLAGDNTYTGDTTISGGVLELSASGKLYNGAANTTNVVTVNAGGTWRLPDYSYAGVGQLAATRERRVLNGGTIEVTGATHSSGQDFTVTAAGGTFRYTASGGTLTLSGTTSSNIALGGPLAFDAGGDITVTETLEGVGSLVKTGAGTLTIGTAATYTGATTVNAGTLRLGVAGTAAGTLSGTPTITVNSGAVLDLPVTDAAGYTLGTQALVINGGTVTQSVTGVRSTLRNTVTMTGGTLTSTGVGDASGNYSFNRGAGITATSDAAGNAATVSAVQIAIQKTGDLPLQVTRGVAAPASDLTITSVIADNMDNSIGNLVKTGNGILTLAGANTYRGNTTVSEGTLLVTNATGSATGAATNKTVTVAAAATLGGTGRIAVATTVAGTLAPGVGGIGTLAIANTLTLGGTTVMQIHKSGTTLASDKVQSVTTLTYGGTLEVTATGDTLNTGDTFTLFSATTYASAGSFATLSLPTLAKGLSWDTSRLKTDGTIKVTGTMAPLQSWRLAHFGTTEGIGSAADAADPDGDGVPNLMEYALGLDPNVAGGIADKLAVDRDTGYLRLTVLKNQNATDVTLGVEVSGDLVVWGSVEGTDVVTEENTATRLVVRDNTPVTAADRRFIRLRVTNPAGP